MRLCSLLVLALACAARAFVLPAQPPAAVARCSAVSTPAVSMTSLDKKAKAAKNKAKSSSAVTKRFKPTATGKLLRRRPFRQHILTKKHPLRKQKLRSVGQVDEGQLQTMQKLMLVVPKRK
mmetsp:Transcript_13030/g.29607  ORF Transcript_13030/g.29607 Transcript_13030/m.29607 type:complete len:121 (+) Transcript_13030:32-394(+)|eukprot:Transcript_17109.p4 GENE.Transcript_17109~~Transcript_17109.p4  ORF type:complete len:121 (-),score=47.37 Transcript_17109:218-580(-)